MMYGCPLTDLQKYSHKLAQWAATWQMLFNVQMFMDVRITNKNLTLFKHIKEVSNKIVFKPGVPATPARAWVS